jgi:hypothetical protein
MREITDVARREQLFHRARQYGAGRLTWEGCGDPACGCCFAVIAVPDDKVFRDLSGNSIVVCPSAANCWRRRWPKLTLRKTAPSGARHDPFQARQGDLTHE